MRRSKPPGRAGGDRRERYCRSREAGNSTAQRSAGSPRRGTTVKARTTAAEKRCDIHATLIDAQGEFHEARTLFAIASRVLDRIDESPRDPGVEASVAPC